MTVEELMHLLAAMPPTSKVLIGPSPESWSFLQPFQVNQVTVLWSCDAVLLGTPPKEAAMAMQTPYQDGAGLVGGTATEFHE